MEEGIVPYNTTKNKALDRREFLKTTGLAIGSLGVSQLLGKQPEIPARSQPNIIFLQADDLGIETITSYGGSSYSTTNIDTLASRGVQFSNCFSSPLCTPTRAQIITGRYGFRTSIDDLASNTIKLDPTKEITLAKILKEAGYDTAVTGKWHLCPKNETTKNITDCDFDEQLCYEGGIIDYGTPDDYLPDEHQAFALDYLEKHQNSTKPFYLQYSFGLPHSPYVPTPLNPNDPPGVDNFPYMVEYMDKLIGEVVAKVDALGMTGNTIIIFAGDNGTERQITSTFQGKSIKGGKGNLKDTGSWVPLIVSGPGIMQSSQCGDLVDYCDFFTTIAELAGANVPSGILIDGRSFVPQLSGQTGNPRDWVYVQLKGEWFIRNKEYKLDSSDKLWDVTNSPFEEIETQNDTVKKWLAEEVKKLQDSTNSSYTGNNQPYKAKHISVTPLPSGQTLIRIPQSNGRDNVTVTIFNLKGKKVFQQVTTDNAILWDGTNSFGGSVGRGEYVIRIKGLGWSESRRRVWK